MATARNKKGFTLAEVLIIVAIVLILAALIAVAVQAYMRSMAKLEYDGYAKEVFIAAQNHLAVAKNLNYLDLDEEDGDFGTAETDDTGKPTGVYYYVVGPGQTPPRIHDLMLPNGALAFDSVGRGVGYIVRYHKDSGQILDVFFWEQSGQRYNLSYNNDYDELMGDKSKETLKKYHGNSVVGYYGGVTAGLINAVDLLAPSISLENGDTLSVIVTDNSPAGSDVVIRMVVHGLSSSATKTFTLPLTGSDPRVTGDGLSYVFTLDDITVSGLRFDQLIPDDPTAKFWPGEDVEVWAEAEIDGTVQRSLVLTDNSLYGTETEAGTDAVIYSFRHLENLGGNVVNFGTNGLQPAKATQTADLNWSDFIGSKPVLGYESQSDVGYYVPVEAKSGLVYDGGGHTITGAKIDTAKLEGPTLGGTGLFAALTNGSVSNLKLEDFTVSGSNASGALAGATDGTALTNVLVCGKDASVSAQTTAGGLVGSLVGGSVTNCAAAVKVTATNGDAGGLVGAASDFAVITGSFAGGQTESGRYNNTYYNITAQGSGAAGGLIGSADSVTVTASYSTASAKSASGAAGGLVGSGSGSFTDSYATGLVTGSVKGAFAGSLSGTVSDCSYYMIINEFKQDKVYDFLPAVGTGTVTGSVLALDRDAAAYEAFVGAQRTWADANAYDAALTLYYGGGYPLKSVSDLGASVSSGDFVAAHYGDWPAPELFVINR